MRIIWVCKKIDAWHRFSDDTRYARGACLLRECSILRSWPLIAKSLEKDSTVAVIKAARYNSPCHTCSFNRRRRLAYWALELNSTTLSEWGQYCLPLRCTIMLLRLLLSTLGICLVCHGSYAVSEYCEVVLPWSIIIERERVCTGWLVCRSNAEKGKQFKSI